MIEVYIFAARPWDSPDAHVPLKRIPAQKQAEIDKCLNCPFSEKDCVNCHARATKNSRDHIRVVVNEGGSAYEISRALGVSIRTAQRHIRKYRRVDTSA